MKKLIALLMVMAVFILFVGFGGYAEAYLYTDDIFVEIWTQGAPISPNTWDDTLGDDTYMVEGLDAEFDISTGLLTWYLYTNYDNDGTYNDPFPSSIADFFIDMDNSGGYETGVVMLDHDLWPTTVQPALRDGDVEDGGDIYSVSATQTADYFYKDQIGAGYGGRSDQSDPMDSIVAIAGGSIIGSAYVSLPPHPGPGYPAYYKWEITMPGLGYTAGDTIGFYWAGISCANDAIRGSVTPEIIASPVPEPSIVWLLGPLLIGLGFLAKKKEFY